MMYRSLVGKPVVLSGNPKIPGSCEYLESMGHFNKTGKIIDLESFNVIVEVGDEKLRLGFAEVRLNDGVFRDGYPNHICTMCGEELNHATVSRKEDSGMGHGLRLDSQGFAWCKNCTKHHDSIDWDSVNNN